MKKGLCHFYLLFTNQHLAAGEAEKATSALLAAGVKRPHLLGYELICELLEEEKSLRALVPRLYGLGDLTEILDERAYIQASAILATMHDDLARLVPVRAHSLAFQALQERGFAFLVGRPGSGKTSIAASLMVAAIDASRVRPIVISGFEDISASWNPNTNDQIIWLDDAFGAQQFDQRTADSFNRSILTIRAALKNGTRFLFTSRDYIFNAARPHLKTSMLPGWDDGQVVIRVEDFSKEEREQILYNHLRLGRQPVSTLRQLNPDRLEAIAAHQNFLPELARRMAEPQFTRSLHPLTGESLLDFVARPDEYLFEVLEGLDNGSRAALGLVHMRGGRLATPFTASDDESEFLDRIGSTASGVRKALADLEGSFLRLTCDDSHREWRFQHPSLSDAFREWLKNKPELLEDYVSSSPIEDLLRTIVCGKVEVERALVVPESLFKLVGRRLATAGKHTRDWPFWARDSVLSFLTWRTNDEFLRYYTSLEPTVVTKAFQFTLMLNTCTERRDLALRLLATGIATEEHRRVGVEQLTEHALAFDDPSFVADEEWLRLFSHEQLATLDQAIRTRLLPRLSSLAVDSLHRSDPPDYESVRSSLEALRARFPDDQSVHEQAASAVAEFEAEHPERRERSASSWKPITSDRGLKNRGPSIFDDLGDTPAR